MQKPVTLREVRDEDLSIFFEQQRDPASIERAAFTSRDPHDKEAFDAHWKKIRANETITIRTVLFEESVAGYIASFLRDGTPEVSYWLGKDFWGKGIGTKALSLFLAIVTRRPLYARVVKDNLASLRVLQKCGFQISGEDKGFAHARGKEVEEFILSLE